MCLSVCLHHSSLQQFQLLSYVLPDSLFIHSFIQATFIAPLQVHYYSEALPPLQGYCVGIPRRSPMHRQLRAKDFPKVPTWRLERDSNLRPFGRRASNLSISHQALWFSSSIVSYRMHPICKPPLFPSVLASDIPLLLSFSSFQSYPSLSSHLLPRLPSFRLLSSSYLIMSSFLLSFSFLISYPTIRLLHCTYFCIPPAAVPLFVHPPVFEVAVIV